MLEDESADKEITLDNYMARVREALDDFEREHREGHEDSPESWPLKMRLGDWDGQLLIFLATPADVEPD